MTGEFLKSRNKRTPLLSIACVTYNHENYIGQAIESFLAQKVDFPIEIIIHDDASTDETADRIKLYQEKYPKLIRPILQVKNQFSQGVNVLERVRLQCVGKYIAVCEGDDYWTDPYKLKKQVEFLENNPEYVVSGHDARIINSDGQIIKKSKLSERFKKNASSYELQCADISILTMSRVFRNIPVFEVEEAARVVSGDVFFISILGGYGRYKYHADIEPSAYRVHSGGVWSPLSNSRKRYEQQNTMYWIYRYHERMGNKKVSMRLKRKYQVAVFKNLNILLLLSALYEFFEKRACTILLRIFNRE